MSPIARHGPQQQQSSYNSRNNHLFLDEPTSWSWDAWDAGEEGVKDEEQRCCIDDDDDDDDDADLAWRLQLEALEGWDDGDDGGDAEFALLQQVAEIEEAEKKEKEKGKGIETGKGYRIAQGILATDDTALRFRTEERGSPRARPGKEQQPSSRDDQDDWIGSRCLRRLQ
ncbi:hypothetical protein SLS58_009443 [Diplodia intermedia]|uniref:Uncharacterized protein n=1 Tax=Diplodia intermedia TaxID=856260 RepID=A0ABR3TCW1_9PEZI